MKGNKNKGKYSVTLRLMPINVAFSNIVRCELVRREKVNSLRRASLISE